MTPEEFKEARQAFGLPKKDFGLLLGYSGDLRNIYQTVNRYEMGIRPIPEMVERLVRMLVWFKADHGYLPDLDNGRREPMMMPEEFAGGE